MLTVGKMRQQAALTDANNRVVIVTDDHTLKALKLQVVEAYPDTCDESGRVGSISTFKIKVKTGAST